MKRRLHMSLAANADTLWVVMECFVHELYEEQVQLGMREDHWMGGGEEKKE